MSNSIESEEKKDTLVEKKDEQEGQPAEPVDPRKKRRTIFIAIVVLVVLVAVGFAWHSYSSTYESTDDAQVDGHLNPIASRVAGTIKSVCVENNQFVEAGKPLIDLDTTDAEITLANSQAQFDQARAQLDAERPNVPIQTASNAADAASAREEVATAAATVGSAQQDYEQSVAELQQAEANSNKAQSDLRRYRQLLDKREVAQADYDQYDSTAKAQIASVNSAKAAVASAAKTIEQKQAQFSEQQAKLRQTMVNAPRQILIKNANIQQRKGSLEAAAAQVRQDQMNLSYCHILAPVSGLVSQRNAEIGARISVGQQLMIVIQTGNLWVTANFKETQLKKVRKGQRASIEVDSLGQTLEGYVESMPAASVDRTSALPPENATGNYVKVVQRLPMRIRFKPNQNGLEGLRPGMSVVPKIFFQ